MTATCNCRNPIINTEKYKDPACERCGHWYMPQYGSGTKMPSTQANPKMPLPRGKPGSGKAKKPTPNRQYKIL